jgi:hypothetical protein
LNVNCNLKLLFRGSERENKFDKTKFHDKCDEKGPTITLIKSKEYGNIFGGYTDIPWSRDG